MKAADSGLNGAKPAAIKSAFINLSVWASEGKKSRANVVLPAPLGPAMMMIFFKQSTLEKNATCARGILKTRYKNRC